MKERNLKDRLDNVSQPFDREALWQNIIEEKPRRRRPVIWFWLLPLIGIISVLTFMWSQDKNGTTAGEKQLTDKYTYEVAEEDIDKAHIQKDNLGSESARVHAIQAGENMQRAKEQDITKTNNSSELIQRQEQSRNTNAADQATITKQSLNTPTVRHTTPPIFQSAEPSSHTNFNVQSESIGVPTLSISRPSEITLTSSTNEPLDFPLLSQDKIYLTWLSRRVDSPSTVNTTAVVPNSVNKWLVFMQLHYGMENHSFSSTKKVGIENELEALGVSTGVGRKLGRLTMRFGLKHTVGNTLLSQNTNRTRFFEGLSSPTKEVATTRYKLYNIYHRTDVFANLNYDILLGRSFEVRPCIGFGANIQSSADGDFFADDLLPYDLSIHPAYGQHIGFYASAGLDVAYNLSKKLTLTVGVALESKRWYTNEHSIQPIDLHLGIVRAW